MNLFPPSVLGLLLLFVVGVLEVISFCCCCLMGHFDPLRAVLVLCVFVVPKFFVTADVVAFSLF